MVNGGIIDRLTVSNIVMSGLKSPIFMRLGNRARPFREGGPKPAIGKFRNVIVSNVQATGFGYRGCSIAGALFFSLRFNTHRCQDDPFNPASRLASENSHGVLAGAQLERAARLHQLPFLQRLIGCGPEGRNGVCVALVD